MSLHGFKYEIKWSNFTTRSSPPPGQEDLIAFTVAKAGSTGKPQAYKNDDGKYYIKSSSIKIEIKMVKSESWVLSNSKTDKLKKHEQMHYNISALGGRDLERGLKNLSADSVDELLASREELTTKIQELIDKTNKEYDNTILWGTDHGRVELHQGFWEMHLAKLMNDPNGELKSIYYVMQR
jgi:hypothetical protein